MMNTEEFQKTYGQRVYTITDMVKYEQYWWGRKPSNKALFEEWLKDPDASMHEVTKRHGKYSQAIQMHSSELKRLGILTRKGTAVA